MSWPDDRKPRFQLISLTGWAITGKATRGSGSVYPHHVYGVVDRAYAHRLVRQYVPTGRQGGRSENCREQAEEAAHELNERDAA